LFATICLSNVFAQQDKNIELAKLLLTSFQKNDFEKIYTAFDTNMKSALSKEKLKLIWADLTAVEKCGDFQKSGDATTEKIKEYDVVYIPCTFKNTVLKMKTVFNKQNNISGLFFVP